jgi:hypothetical protein
MVMATSKAMLKEFSEARQSQFFISHPKKLQYYLKQYSIRMNIKFNGCECETPPGLQGACAIY